MLKHGVYSQERPSALIGLVAADSALPLFVGTAPVHTVAGDASVNELVLLTSWQDVVDTFGYVHDFSRYTLIEALYSHFRVFGFAPVLAINAFNPSSVTGDATATAVTLANGSGTLEVAGALVQSVTDDAEGTTTYVEGTDYNLTYDTNGYPVVTRISTGAIASDSASVYVNHLVIGADKAGVSGAAIVTTLDQMDSAFARYSKVPMLLAAPGFSSDATVAAAMIAKTEWGGGFYAYALTDIPTDADTGADAATEVAAWKSTNSYTDENQDVLWPLVKIGDDTFHLSTIMAGALAAKDYENGGVPFASASNLPLSVTAAVNAAGTEIYLRDDQANDLLNANGVTTVINAGSRGWVTWGNRTGAYPGDTDPINMWRNYRRMLIWLKNTMKLTLLQKVDEPGNLRQIESIINTINVYLNGLYAQGALIGNPSVEFRREDNPTTELIDGHYTFTINVTPPTAMEAITLIWQVDTSQFATLFSN